MKAPISELVKLDMKASPATPGIPKRKRRNGWKSLPAAFKAPKCSHVSINPCASMVTGTLSMQRQNLPLHQIRLFPALQSSHHRHGQTAPSGSSGRMLSGNYPDALQALKRRWSGKRGTPILSMSPCIHFPSAALPVYFLLIHSLAVPPQYPIKTSTRRVRNMTITASMIGVANMTG